ncbi:hypothetical protein JOC70_000360 [Clostridium pascui]|uniref:hypothetical protein n=1 Tax=Clostridium pascui TaxID=46609 RepID=UPI00195DC4B7|nr:hypothetical protein [Clostridium pascui]MBM7868891.1 hypothetical protein [Clostridium pascui]
MVKTFYLQVNKGTNIITDAVEYEHEGYIPYATDSLLPIGVYGGWFKLESGVIVEYPELKPILQENEVTQLKAEQVLMKKAMDDLIFNMGGAL